MLLTGAVLVTCFSVAGATRVAAQLAPVFLEPGHWTYDAIRRLNAVGVAPPSSDPALAPVTLQHAFAVFSYAKTEAERQGRPGLAQLAAGYATLLASADTVGTLAYATMRAGWLGTTGEALGGDGYIMEEDWEGAQPLDDANGAAVAVRAYGWLHRRVAWSAEGGYLGDRWAVPAAAATVAVGPFDVWAGRRTLHYGIGRGGGIVLGSGMGANPELAHRMFAPIDGVGVHVREPFHFPGFLRVLGPDRIEIVAGRLPRNGLVDSPFVIFGRLIGTPFTRRLTLGVNRGAIFGGEGNAITLSRLAALLVGVYAGDHGEFENQVFSAVIRLRPPLGPLPLELYYERGMDDTAGSFFDVPGTVAGLDIGAVPGLPAVSFGVEHTRYAPSCCGNPIWYRSVFFRGSWGDEGRLFAHPLGGHGQEWLAHMRVDLPQHGLLVRGEAFSRDRGAENLFAPEREHNSRGGSLALDYHVRGRALVRVDAAYEDGAQWALHRISVSVSYNFGGRQN